MSGGAGGEGRYVDDFAPDGLAHLVFVRSPHAHARLRGVDADAARALPGARLQGRRRHLLAHRLGILHQYGRWGHFRDRDRRGHGCSPSRFA